MKHIVDAAARVEDFTRGMMRKDFLKDTKTQSAVIKELMVIGEATKRLSFGLKQKHPDIPWEDIAGARDVFVHRYFEVKLDEIWNTVEKDIPQLRRAIEGILAGLEPIHAKR